MPDKIHLRQFQALPLLSKVLMTELRIREWFNYFHGDVYVAFSGGKDSTVLADLVHKNYPEVPLVFSNTGLEYPEIQAFARKMGAEFVRPKMSFSEVISKYGYPIISKENAEAIYYARRIKNNMGGGTNKLSENGKNCWGKETIRRKTADQKRRELNGSRIFMWGGTNSETYRRRSNLINATADYNQARNEQTGMDTEEKALPG